MARQKGNKNMRNKMLGILLPVLAGVAVIGTGFSTWYFVTGGIQTKKQELDVQLAAAAEIGDLVITNNPAPTTLHLDASIKDPADSGIHLGTLADGAFTPSSDTINWSYTYQASAETLGKHPEITVAVNIVNIDSYIGIALSDEDTDYTLAGTATSGYKYTWTYEDETIAADYTTGQENTITQDFTFVFSWKENKEPTSYDTWSALNTEIDKGDTKLIVNLSLDWVA